MGDKEESWREKKGSWEVIRERRGGAKIGVWVCGCVCGGGGGARIGERDTDRQTDQTVRQRETERDRERAIGRW